MIMESSLADSPSEAAADQSISEAAASAASATSTTTCSLGIKEAAATSNNNEINSNNNDDEPMMMDTSTISDDGHLSTRMETEEANDNNNNNSEADDVNTRSDNLLHEHHHRNSNSSGNNNSIHHPMIIQQCKSIEEASVNTTVESVIMMNASDLDEVVENDNNNNNSSSSNEKSDANMQPSSPSSSSGRRSVSLQLTPEEERLFTLLINAAEAYEQNKLDIDPNPTEGSVSARGGFTSASTGAAAGAAAAAAVNTKKGDSGNKSDNEMAEEEQEKEEVASWLKPPPKVDHIEIRVAGGWVRDKLLNQHSVDVDVALDCMMGVQFARIVQSYLLLLDKKEEEEQQQQQQQQQQQNDDDEEKLMMVDDEEQTDDINSNSKKPPSKRGHEMPKKKKKSRQPKIGVIGANPSQSKHLETATMNIHGIDVDFVNLRAEEVYEANSRIPTSKTRMFGTPLEDALRRDFTINSLFYNVRSGKVEDWTGRGLTDLLDNRLIVTPVDPHETFHDDPLRVLRAIRFCVRLDFSLHDDIRQAAMSKRVHHSLHVKVSRERVGKELEGMMTGKHARPGRALDMIAELHLAGSVFAFPGSFPGDFGHVSGPVTGRILDVDYHGCCGKDGPDAVALAATHRAKGWDESSALLALLPKIMESHVDERERYFLQKQLKDGEVSGGGGESSSNGSSASVMDARLLHICVFILPFHNLTFPDAKGRKNYVTTHMIKEALKWSTKDIQAVSKILEHVDEMADILSDLRSQSQSFQQQQQQQSQEGGDGNDASQLSAPCRLRSGLLLRSLKEHWVTCLLAAAAWEIRSYQRLREEDGTSTSTAEEQPSRDLYRAIVGELDLDECWRVRPHLNGKEIIKELSLPKGPVVGMYIEDQTKWMLLNPNGTREECMSHLVERKREREQDIVTEVEEEENAIVDEQNESYVGVANGEGQTSPDSKDGSTTKHFSKKIRSDTVEEADDTAN